MTPDPSTSLTPRDRRDIKNLVAWEVQKQTKKIATLIVEVRRLRKELQEKHTQA